jgi:hypothetical protein
MGEQYVLMRLHDFTVLLGGQPAHHCDCPVAHDEDD